MADIPKVYIARAGRNGEDEDRALDNNIAIIGFHDVPSLKAAKNYDAIAELVDAALPDLKPRARTNFSRQLSAFALTMGEGDFVVLPRKLTSQIAIGRVTGPYRYSEVGGEPRHTRAVDWARPDVPRTTFGQDLLHSFGAFMTVCNVSRNDAARRVAAVFAGKPDPGTASKKKGTPEPTSDPSTDEPDLAQSAHDQIVARIQMRFAGHALARLVDAVLRADGWETKLSPAGPDGGVDVLGGRGPLGLDPPRLCVQVKSQQSPADVEVYRGLQGTMLTFKAEQGLLVCWGGFKKSVLTEARQSHFVVRLWDSRDLVQALYRNYERLPAEIQAELPLKRVWMLVPEETTE